MKKIILAITMLLMLTLTAQAQSDKLNRTKTKKDTITTYPNGTPRDVSKDKGNPDKNSTTTPQQVPTTKDPNNPNNNTNGTKPKE